MLSSWFGILVMIGLLFVPGTFIYFLLRKHFEKFDFLDTTITVFLFSAIFNFLFFFVRLYPAFRLSAYLIGLGVLTWFSWKEFKKSHMSFEKTVKPLVKKHWKKWMVPIVVLIIGAVMVGYPYHSLNESRLQPNTGGDVELYLYKSNLLQGGYSIFDDLYGGQVNFYPTFYTAEVALATLFTQTGLAPNAETFRVILIVLIFGLMYAFGRSIKLSKPESMLFTLFTLCGYSIWSHLDLFVVVGMSFFGTLIFMYLLARSVFTNRPVFWILSGLAGSLAVHSHPVHGVYAGLFSFVVIAAMAIHLYLKGKPLTLDKALAPLKWFFYGTAPLIGFYLIPLILKYQLDATSTWYQVEHFDTTYGQFFQSLVDNPHLLVGMCLTALVWILALIFRKKKPAAIYELLPLAHVYGLIFILTVGLRVFAIKMHHLAIYIDAGDFFTFLHAMSWLFMFLIVYKLLALANKKLTNKLSWVVSIFILFSIFPPSPLNRFNPPFLWRYGPQIWDYTKLPEAEGDYAQEGNMADPSWDEFAEAVQSKIPLWGTTVLMNPNLTHAFGSHFERRVTFYANAHSNVFLKPSWDERAADHTRLFEEPNEERFREMIDKYDVTHFLWSWQDPEVTKRAFSSWDFLEEVPDMHWRGILYEVNLD
jgi:hypothetical protein